MKKNYGLIIVIVFYFLGNFILSNLPGILSALRGSDYARPILVQYEADLSLDGHLDVTEYTEYEIHASSNTRPFRELYREIFISTTDRYRGVTYTNFWLEEIQGNSIKTYTFVEPDSPHVESRTVGYFTFIESDYRTGEGGVYYEIRWFINETEGLKKYRFGYLQSNILSMYNDCADLYLMHEEGDSVKTIREYDIKINFPSSITATPLKTDYLSAHNEANMNAPVSMFSHRQPNAQLEMTSSSFHLNVKNPHSKLNLNTIAFIETRLIFDKQNAEKFHNVKNYTTADIREEFLKAEVASADSLKMLVNLTTIFSVADIVIALIVCVVFYFGVKFVRNKRERFKPAFNYTYFREIPEGLDAASAAHFVDMKRYINEKEMAGTMMALIQKGALSVNKIKTQKDWSDSNICFSVNKKIPTLTETERALYDYMGAVAFKKKGIQSEETLGDSVTFKDINSFSTKNHLNASALEREFERAKKSGIAKEGYLDPNQGKTPQAIQAFPIAAIVIATALSIIVVDNILTHYGFAIITPAAIFLGMLYAFFILRKVPVLTQKGADAYMQWSGLYNFFNKLSIVDEAELPQVVRWEEYLAYATAFGLADKVLKTLQMRLPATNNEQFSNFGGSYIAARVITRNISMRSSSFRYVAPSSGGVRGGGGGGSRGGGGGGGGGGGRGGRH